MAPLTGLWLRPFLGLRRETTRQACLDAGADFVLIGRGAILHHDFAARVVADPAFASTPTPVTRAHLQAEGLGEAFVNYMASWKGFVEG